MAEERYYLWSQRQISFLGKEIDGTASVTKEIILLMVEKQYGLSKGAFSAMIDETKEVRRHYWKVWQEELKKMELMRKLDNVDYKIDLIIYIPSVILISFALILFVRDVIFPFLMKTSTSDRTLFAIAVVNLAWLILPALLILMLGWDIPLKEMIYVTFGLMVVSVYFPFSVAPSLRYWARLYYIERERPFY
jgi:hypothetical protein